MTTAAVEPLVLIAEDDPLLADLLHSTLEQEGFRTLLAADGRTAIKAARQQMPDLILLDLVLPGLSGLEVCTRVRRHRPTHGMAIIMLTACDDEAAKVRGFNAGADDYVVKPFSLTELVARMHAVLRRSGFAPGRRRLEAGDLVMDLAARTVQRAGRPIHLGPTSFSLLRQFLSYPGQVLSREQLQDAVCGRDRRN